jgi:uncharacterized protein YggE
MRHELNDDRIEVTGRAERDVEPSAGRWSIVVEEEERDAAEAFEQCSARARAVVEQVEPLLGDEGRLTTGPVTVQPRRRDYDGPVIGHRATARLEVESPLERSGDLAAAAMRAGASALSGPHPRYAGEAEARVELLREAVGAARAKAETIAAAAGRELGRVVSVAESDDDHHVVQEAALSADHAGPPVQPGARTVAVTVRVAVELQ